MYLIDTKRLKGAYTKDSLKAYKLLEAFNYFHSGHVRTIYYYQTVSSSLYAILMAEVNPSKEHQLMLTKLGSD